MRRSTLSSKRVFKSTLQSGRIEFANHIIRNYHVNRVIRKHQFSSPVIKKIQLFQSSGRTNVNPAIRKDRGQSCKNTKVKKRKKSSSEKLNQTLSSKIKGEKNPTIMKFSKEKKKV
jgi:hypothetical protein